MRDTQGSYFTGYVTILIKGDRPELFFQKCMDKGITVWNVRKLADDQCEGNIKLYDIKQIKELRRGTNYKINFTKRKGYPFLFRRFIRKKQVLIGLLLSLLLIIFLSNIIWEVKISGVPKDIEEKISKQLDSYGIHPGSWIFSLDSPNAIQQKLVEDVPELLWVGVEQKGTTFFLEGVEKIIVKEEEIKGPRNLIATKKGIIKKMYVSKGLPKVEVNDYVKLGDVLVSGIINGSEEEDETDKKAKKLELVAAEGEITATTWYEVTVTVPLKGVHEELTGNQEKKYYLRFGEFRLPVWGFNSPEYDHIHREINEENLKLFNWNLPVKIGESILSEKSTTEMNRSKEEAVQVGISQAKSELKLQLGPKAQIISEKVLQETTDNGKVKLNLYINVEEDIAEAQPINQGD
ncbi:sporulation protein YqfD [Virgibacillus profundi]|uniref:Sporulation protein YqfD n=1 Tax=Virgibacillus profundi TaxID=2024555 RepID=A0A2A2ICD6_9BACI|nr:sporulation protein YqfD [Virgibacillus profundi]PAV29028.1 sporulation protein YqfD [Virgibacillus profundi]PXY53197.1 sporulation protein YqfD [Virgibacillus profundi]